MQDLIETINAKCKYLEMCISKVKSYGMDRAQTESDYRIALQIRIGELRATGTPVTIVNDMARGTPKIAQLKVKRDIAETMYNACLEEINCTKLTMKLLSEQINREWNSGGK